MWLPDRFAVFISVISDSPALQPFVPYEFTAEVLESFFPRAIGVTNLLIKGFLERVGVYIQNQNFCDGVNLAEGKKGRPTNLIL